MKQKRRIFGRLLTSIALLVGSLSCAFNGNAQMHYRGFVEGGLGADYQTDNRQGNFTYYLATTHGVQLKNNYIGLGLGIMPGFFCSDLSQSKITLPLYANWRYDFFSVDMPLKPYVGIKAGYFIPTSEFIDSYGFAFYGALDFGFRKRISQSSGISFGLAIQTSSDAGGVTNYYYTCSWAQFGMNFLVKVIFDF